MKYQIVTSAKVDGQYRSFLKDTNGTPVSPLFPSLAELFPWMRDNGYQLDESQGETYMPGRVSKV